jgi:hypothetical protein
MELSTRTRRTLFAIFGIVAAVTAASLGVTLVALTSGGSAVASTAPVSTRTGVAEPTPPAVRGGMAPTVSAAPTVTVTSAPRIVIKRVPVPGPTVVRTVPGPVRYVRPVNRCTWFTFPALNQAGALGERADGEWFCDFPSYAHPGAVVLSVAGLPSR